MLTTLLAWIYISFLSWMWGVLFLQFIKKITKSELQLSHFSIICITGLSAITIIAGIISLLIPLGEWWVQFLFILPCIGLFFKKKPPAFFSALKKEFQNLHIISIILLTTCLLLILVMSTWTIIHPDTLGYHAQTIQWIEKYRAVPGLVNLHVRFGYQGLWFVDAALFGFSFTGKEGITFLNSTVLFWFFIFITNRINYNFFKEGNNLYGILWTALLVISIWSYTQVRLTATSASPDFIASLYVLSIVYILFQKNDLLNWLLAAFLSLVAITIKLSVAPIFLIAATGAIIFLKERKVKLLLALVIISTIIFLPFVVRNIITSGYVVFPSTILDIAEVDWKYGRQLTISEKNYITVYAKKPGVTTKGEIDSVARMSPPEWVPEWWQNCSAADKSIMVLLFFSILAALILLRKIIQSGFVAIFLLTTMLLGIIFWFVNAPDPRFGFGQMIGFISVVAYLVFLNKNPSLNKTKLISIVFFVSGVISAYTVYRFTNFFQLSQLLSPLGIENVEFRSFDCHGIRINQPSGNNDFGKTPVPCTDLGCENFIPRGNDIKDGFRSR